MIATEQEKLERKIAELEEQPLEFFGSQKNKRVRIGYYRYRLEALMQDPDKYFQNPEGFEGNVKEPMWLKKHLAAKDLISPAASPLSPADSVCGNIPLSCQSVYQRKFCLHSEKDLE